jgi:hypothetical protein
MMGHVEYSQRRRKQAKRCNSKKQQKQYKWLINEHMKSYKTSVVIKEINIKTIRHHFLSITFTKWQ